MFIRFNADQHQFLHLCLLQLPHTIVSKFYRVIHKALWWLLYITPVVLASYYFGGKLVRKILIDQLNEQLNTKVVVHAINLNGLRTFPNLSLELTNVRIEESTPHFEQHMTRVRKVVVAFNPLKLISGKNEIDKIQFHSGVIRLFVDKDGASNFELFKPSEDESDEALQIDLKDVELKNVQCVYVDHQSNNSFNFTSDLLDFSGKFNDQHFLLQAKGDALFDHLNLDGTDYIMGKRCQMNVVVDINQDIQSYHIEKGQIGLDNLLMDVEGDILMVNNYPDVELNLSGDHIDIQSILSILPNDIRYQLRDFTSRGDIAVNGTVVGLLNGDSIPDMNIDFSFDNASVSSKRNQLDIEKINLTGNLNSVGEALALTTEIKEVILSKSALSGKISIEDILHPNIDFQLKGLANLTDLRGLIDAEETSGKVGFNLTGLIPVVKDTINFTALKINGDVEAKDLNIPGKPEEEIRKLYASAHINNDELTKVKVKGGIWNNNVDFTGTINHWLSYATNQKRLKVLGDVKSTSMNLNFLNGDSSTTATEEIQTDLDLNVDVSVSVEAEQFVWNNFDTRRMSGNFEWKHNDLYFTNMAFDAWGGNNQLDADLIQNDSNFKLSLSGFFENVKIERLLKEFDNFDQTEFTPEILMGEITTTLNYSMYFDRFFNVLEDSIFSLAQVQIKNGRLRNYKPMESLSSFVELDDLKDIKFKEMSNTVEIRDRTIYIPTTEVQSNAMNLTIGGTHNFDNFMDYRLKIRITELLASKSGWVKKKKERQLEENKEGGLSAYVIMVGTPDDLKIKYDRKTVQENIKKEIKKETKSFFQDLKKEIKREKSNTKDRRKVEWDE